MLWVKTFHLFFMIAWFACIFYLPRLFVNYAIADNDSTRQQLLLMQKKLLKFSMPWALLTIVFGFWLMSFNPSYYATAGWLHAKIALVLLLVIYHGVCALMVKQFSAGAAPRSHVFYRWFNEFPVLLLLGILILVVIKPF